jgi:hypothetical protein
MKASDRIIEIADALARDRLEEEKHGPAYEFLKAALGERAQTDEQRIAQLCRDERLIVAAIVVYLDEKGI